jgi:hypothetical protein
VRFTHWLVRSGRAGPEHIQVRKLTRLRSGIRFGRNRASLRQEEDEGEEGSASRACPTTLAHTHADIKPRKIGETGENFAEETERSAPKRALQQVYALLVALGIAVSRTGSSSSSTSAGGTYSSFEVVFFFSLSPFSRFACFPQTFAFPTLAYCGFSGDGSRNNYQLAMKCGYSTKKQ